MRTKLNTLVSRPFVMELVSYTHFGANETVSKHVARLWLKKKNQINNNTSKHHQYHSAT